ncbi:MAG: CRISPR-associated endonuclease Cas2 [bacterium]
MLDKMGKRIRKLIKEEEDSVRIYEMCANCEKKIKIIGLGRVTEDKEVYIV